MKIYYPSRNISLIIAMGVLLALAGGCHTREKAEKKTEKPAAGSSPGPSLPLEPSVWDGFVFPTDQHALLDADPTGAFQPTASGKTESAFYGSVRTTRQGKRLLSSFHEGIDIAACRRDRKRNPLDRIYAVADGTVAYVNTIAGNSTYGRYVVLTHDDPLGPVFTLYAHLAKISSGLKPGRQVRAGEVLGVMGNSGLLKIPLYRAHLHFEVGMILNLRFVEWARSRKMKADHGVYNGWNLLGMDPLAFMNAVKSSEHFSFQSYLESISVAFEVVFNVRRLPDYFRRYPMLWNGPDFSAGTITIACSENGIPLNGRAANRAEKEALGEKKQIVRKVNREALGRNGCHLISFQKGNWTLGKKGERWLSLLTY